MKRFLLAAVGAAALLAPGVAMAGLVQAGEDAIQTKPGDASGVLPGLGLIPLEGATDFSSPARPLTAAEVTRPNALAPDLRLVKYHLPWGDEHGSCVRPTSSHKL